MQSVCLRWRKTFFCSITSSFIVKHSWKLIPVHTHSSLVSNCVISDLWNLWKRIVETSRRFTVRTVSFINDNSSQRHRGKISKNWSFRAKRTKSVRAFSLKLNYIKPFKVCFWSKLYVFARFDQYSLSFSGAWCSSELLGFLIYQ